MFRPTTLTELPVDQRRSNPVIETAPEAELLTGVAPEAEVVLDFVVPGAETAWGYSTAGGFTMPSTDISSAGEAQVTWIAPVEYDGPVGVYVVFEDGLGGTAVWRTQATPPSGGG